MGDSNRQHAHNLYKPARCPAPWPVSKSVSSHRACHHIHRRRGPHTPLLGRRRSRRDRHNLLFILEKNKQYKMCIDKLHAHVWYRIGIYGGAFVLPGSEQARCVVYVFFGDILGGALYHIESSGSQLSSVRQVGLVDYFSRLI